MDVEEVLDRCLSTHREISSSSLPDISQSSSRVGSPIKRVDVSPQERVNSKPSSSERLPSLEDVKPGVVSSKSSSVHITPELQVRTTSPDHEGHSEVTLTDTDPQPQGQGQENTEETENNVKLQKKRKGSRSNSMTNSMPTKSTLNAKSSTKKGMSHIRRLSMTGKAYMKYGLASPRLTLVDSESAKAEIYRDFVGRRNALDHGQRQKTRQKALEAQEAFAKGQASPAGSVASTPRAAAGVRPGNGTSGNSSPVSTSTGHSSSGPATKKTTRRKQNGEKQVGSSPRFGGSDGPSSPRGIPKISRTGPNGSPINSNDSNMKSGGGALYKQLGLTEQQIKAFLEVFELFDSNGGGTIDADELDQTLRSVGICLTRDEIKEVLQTIDKDGNGEIDFHEFLQLMTNTERFLESVAEGENENRENLLFEALTEFMKKSALNSMDEIVGYFHTKYKRVQVPHVVNHYAAGARLIGLSEKQLKQHLERLKASNASRDQSINSPYAQPLHIVMSATNVKSAIAVDNGIPLQQPHQPHTGRITLRIKMPREVQDEGEERKVIKVKQKPAFTSPTRQFRHGRGWTSQRTDHIEVLLPPKLVKKNTPFDQLTAEDLLNIRSNVNTAKLDYRLDRRHSQIDRNLRHWKTLQADLISPRILRNHFRMVFSHYSAVKPSMLPLAVH